MKHLFFDCDDCLYQNDWATANKITKNIGDYCSKELGVGPERAYELYKKYGTCLRGMLIECLMPRDMVEDFLVRVHDIDYSDIDKDDALREIVKHCGDAKRRFVFTASTSEHADRCLRAVGVRDLFYSVVDTRTCRLESKHSPEAFDCAMLAAGTNTPTDCVLFDDSVKNIKQAKKLGWTTVLVGLTERDTGKTFTCADADFHIDSLHDLPTVLPGLFPPGFIAPPRKKKQVDDPAYPRLAG